MVATKAARVTDIDVARTHLRFMCLRPGGSSSSFIVAETESQNNCQGNAHVAGGFKHAALHGSASMLLTPEQFCTTCQQVSRGTCELETQACEVEGEK